MRTDGRESDNVEDRRGQSGVGMPRGIRIGRGGLGIGTILIALVAMFVFGIDPRLVLGLLGGSSSVAPTQMQAPAEPAGKPSDELGRFVSVVLADTEDTWHALFRGLGGDYREPTLVLYRNATASSCGLGQAAMGPFYCPMDEKVYLDLAFFDELQTRFKAPGDFAQAYVIAHEVGHHVQNLLGINSEVQAMQRRASQTEANELSVRLELQADCLAGVWGYHTQRARDMLEAGDLEEALNAASAIGDDRIQRESTGRVVPDSFTHGSSAQRVRWFKRGLSSGDINQCDTFDVAAAEL